MSRENFKVLGGFLKQTLPNGLSEEIWCGTNNELAKKNCLANSGSPGIWKREGTARGQYFEQHFVLGSLL